MTPQEIRSDRMAKKLIQNLERRHFEAYYCRTTEEIIQKVKSIIPEGSSITWGGSMTIRDIGLTQALKDGPYVVFDRDDAKNEEEKLAAYRKAFEADFYLSSVNALSEDGVIVNIDGNGNRVAAITWGPKRVIFVIGLNKVAQDVNAALHRPQQSSPRRECRPPACS